MGLTLGTGPLAPDRAGVFNGAVSVSGRPLYFEPAPRRVRGVFAGRTVLDSRGARLLHEPGCLPQWYFPAADVRLELLEATERKRDPIKGEARYFTLRVGERVFEDAAWQYERPCLLGPDLSGYVSFHFWALDEWWEEGERARGHPRDPYHRVDVLSSARRVVISLAGQELARSQRALVVYETGLVARHYIPSDDVRLDLLEQSATTTFCPYKGEASYWALPGGDEVAWTYRDPLAEVSRLGGLVSFYDEKVDVELDGELQSRPRTLWG